MSYDIIVSKNELVSAIEKKSVADIIKPLVNEIHLFDTFVAGTSYIKDKSALASVVEGEKLNLRRENNKFDDNAILILNKDGAKLGYVPEKDDLIFSRLMDAGKLLIAKVTDIEDYRDFRKIKIGIYLVDY